MARVKKTVKAASAGIPGADHPVVEFSNDGRMQIEGPAGRHNEQEHTRTGFHLRRKFSGLNETELLLCTKARSIFDLLQNTSSKKASWQRVDSGAAGLFGCR